MKSIYSKLKNDSAQLTKVDIICFYFMLFLANAHRQSAGIDTSINPSLGRTRIALCFFRLDAHLCCKKSPF